MRRLRGVAAAERQRRAFSFSAAATPGNVVGSSGSREQARGTSIRGRGGGGGGGLGAQILAAAAAAGAGRDGGRDVLRSADESGSGSGRRGRGEAAAAPEVEATMLELRRVAVHGDATTLDVLLSSQVRTTLFYFLFDPSLVVLSPSFCQFPFLVRAQDHDFNHPHLLILIDPPARPSILHIALKHLSVVASTAPLAGARVGRQSLLATLATNISPEGVDGTSGTEDAPQGERFGQADGRHGRRPG